MSSSLSASQLHTVNMRDPLNRVLGETPRLPHPMSTRSHTHEYVALIHPVAFSTANLFLLISSVLGSKMAGPHTQFVQSFMEECVDCLEQGSRGSILQFMPFTMVSYGLRREAPGRGGRDKEGDERLLHHTLSGGKGLEFCNTLRT